MDIPSQRKTVRPALTRGDNLFTMVCACNALKNKADLPMRQGAVVAYTDNVCPGCTRDFSGLAILVCGKCRVVVGRTPPCVDKRTGFRMEANKVYHLDKCPVCADLQPGNIACTSRLIEKVLHELRLGLEPVPSTPRL